MKINTGIIANSIKPPDNNSLRQSISQVAGVNWGVKYLYLVRIDKLDINTLVAPDKGYVKQPFSDNIVPAYSVNETYSLARTENIKLPVYGNFQLPVGKEITSIQISMYDNEECVVETALRVWASKITGKSLKVAYLDDITSHIALCKLSSNRDLVFIAEYMGYPKGDITINMSSDNGLKELIVDFAVTESLGSKEYPLKIK